MFIDLLNKFPVGNIDDDAEKLLTVRFTHKPDEKYPKNALCMYIENEPVMKRNEAVLNDFNGELYSIGADDKIPDNCKYPLATSQAGCSESKTNEL